jgi:asparagine synthase (glutamine-hydrolysing)
MFDRVQRAMLHRAPYSYRALARSAHFAVGLTAFDRYPAQLVERPEFTACVEGMIYDRDRAEIERDLERIAAGLGQTGRLPREAVEQFVAASDGEFLVVLCVPGRKRLVVFNDALARLPAYVHHEPGRLAVSREVKFLLPYLGSFELDRNGILEYLLFGFTFGRNTLVEGARYLRPRSILDFDAASGELAVFDGAPRNFEETSWTSRSAAVAQLKESFLGAISARASRLGGDVPVVSLSGGLDSRGTLAGLVAAGARPVAVTIEGPEQSYAARAAAALGVEIRVLPQPKSAADFAAVAFWKDGLDCHPGLEHLYRYPETMLDLLGEGIVYYTGIYGGEITRYRNPTSAIRSTHDLARHLLTARDTYKYSTERSCALLGMSVQEAQRHVEDYVGAFPETTALRRYIHFRHQFDVKYAGEAEDRNRFFFWTVSPYFSERFFRAAMALGENHKDTPLFRDFLHAVDPRTCEVPYYNFRMPMKPRALLYGVSAAERLVRVPAIKSATRRGFAAARFARSLLRGRVGADPEAVARMETLRGAVRALLGTSSAAARCFDMAAAARIIDSEQDEQGLERMRILFAYFKAAEAWHASMRSGG